MAIRHTAQQYESAYPDGIEFHYWHSSRNRILCDQLRKINFSGVALDVGCGRAMDVQKFRDAGFNYFGVEVSNPTPYFAKTSEYLSLNQSSLELPEDFRNSVRLLSFLDVLPHIEDPYSFVEQHRVRFPNVKYMLAWIVGRQELYSNYDRYVGAFRRYSLDECRDLFPGSKVITLHYCFHLLYCFAFALKFFKLDRGVNIQAPDAGNSITMHAHKLISDYLFLESKLFPKRLFGSSIVCLVEL